MTGSIDLDGLDWKAWYRERDLKDLKERHRLEILETCLSRETRLGAATRVIYIGLERLERALRTWYYLSRLESITWYGDEAKVTTITWYWWLKFRMTEEFDDRRIWWCRLFTDVTQHDHIRRIMTVDWGNWLHRLTCLTCCCCCCWWRWL